ncbi:hypothetical protein HMPREF0758_0921 [Serratia odorifera DSM 4582]|uniref:Lipoprotein n=1 Tax=Serratia odorifera DSM 4582 TaxID=667129 RepID=D4DYC1_SEROD|nr:hypothetical protein HMPREF0758_0921 [Serratia odorifera DSM 4582]
MIFSYRLHTFPPFRPDLARSRPFYAGSALLIGCNSIANV